MGLSDIIANGIATARAITLDLHVTVTLQQWIGQNAFGKPTYAMPLTLEALLNYEVKNIKMSDGQEAVSEAYLAFLEPVTPATPTSPYTRQNPIDERDIITYPNGNTGPILRVDGFANGVTGVPYYSQVYMGRSERAA